MNPKTPIDIDILQITNQRYANGGLSNIDGMLIDLCDNIEVSNIFAQQVLSGPTLNEKVIIIDPALDILFQGIKSKRDRYFDMPLFRGIERASNVPSEVNPLDYKINHVYPLMDINFIREVLILLLQTRTDICIYPNVPLTSKRVFEEQFMQLEYMIRISNNLMNTIIDPDRKIDRMLLIALNPTIINPETSSRIVNIITNYDVEHIGIKLIEDPEKDIEILRNFVNLIDSIYNIINLKGKKPLFHLWNTREMGYMAWGHGVDVIGNPISRFPYYRTAEVNQPYGKYYHPVKKIYIGHDSLINETRHRNYQLPCYCSACQNASSILRTNESSNVWNRFRKTHFLLTKNQEIDILKNSEFSIRRAVHSFFADNQCENTTYLPFLT